MKLRLSRHARVGTTVTERPSTTVTHVLSSITNVASIVSFIGVYLIAYMSECARPSIGALLYRDDLVYGGSFFLFCLLAWMLLAFLEGRMGEAYNKI